MIITLKDVTKKIRGNIVADHVNLTLKSGTVYGLCGYNGCGKTMLMRLIAGLIIPTEGEITFDGRVLGRDIDFPESKGKITDEMIIQTIERVGLEPKDKKKYRKYSLGMKQRLGIAAAIMESPKLVILDEPTNALDSDGVELTKKLIAEERQRDALVIMTCHDREILEGVCDIVYTIEHGRITDEKHIHTEGAAE